MPRLPHRAAGLPLPSRTSVACSTQGVNEYIGQMPLHPSRLMPLEVSAAQKLGITLTLWSPADTIAIGIDLTVPRTFGS